eukprot:g10905.t1
MYPVASLLACGGIRPGPLGCSLATGLSFLPLPFNRGARPQRPAAGARGAAAKGGQGNNQQGIMRFYTDDAPGLRIGPTVVLVFSLAFIGCVVLLHIWGKFKG